MDNYKTKIIGFSVLLFSTQPYAATISFVPSSTNLILGESLSVDVKILETERNTAVGNYDFDVNFNPAVINTYERDVTLGNQLQQSGVSSLKKIRVEGGQLNISEVSLNDAQVLNSLQSDEFTVATLDFTTTAAGVSPLGFSVNSLGNQDGRKIKHE